MAVAPVPDRDGDVAELVLGNGGPLRGERGTEVTDGAEVLDLGPGAERPVDDRVVGEQRRHRADVAAARRHRRAEHRREFVGVVGVLGHDRHAARDDPVEERVHLAHTPVAVVDPAVVHDVDVGEVGRGEVGGRRLERDRVVERDDAGWSEVRRVLDIGRRRRPLQQVVAVATRDGDVGQRQRCDRSDRSRDRQHSRHEAHRDSDGGATSAERATGGGHLLTVRVACRRPQRRIRPRACGNTAGVGPTTHPTAPR